MYVGPYGAVALDSLCDMPEARRLTFQFVFQICGDLFAKEVAVSDLPDLQLRVIEALCLMELHLPASEANIKLHNLLHLVFDVLPTFGELMADACL